MTTNELGELLTVAWRHDPQLAVRVPIDTPCEYCGAYAKRCHEDRDDGKTYCAITGKAIEE